jgi:transposase
VLLLVGDDWAEEHHDVEVQDEHGRVLGKAKLPEGIAGIDRLHAMIGQHVGEDDEAQVVVGIETDRGPWVQALLAAGYQVYPINSLQVARYRERHAVSGAKSDAADAHTLADMVRTDRHQLRPSAGDSPVAEAVKVLAWVHKTLIWERTRHALRLRSALLEFFPAAVAVFADLTAADALQLLAKAPDRRRRPG